MSPRPRRLPVAAAAGSRHLQRRENVGRTSGKRRKTSGRRTSKAHRNGSRRRSVRSDPARGADAWHGETLRKWQARETPESRRGNVGKPSGRRRGNGGKHRKTLGNLLGNFGKTSENVGRGCSRPWAFHTLRQQHTSPNEFPCPRTFYWGHPIPREARHHSECWNCAGGVPTGSGGAPHRRVGDGIQQIWGNARRTRVTRVDEAGSGGRDSRRCSATDARKLFASTQPQQAQPRDAHPTADN
eukprot:gene15553-biopygen11403